MKRVRLMGVPFVCAILAASSVPGAQLANQGKAFERRGDFVLRLEGGLLSLDAQESSLAKIVEELGRRLGAKVVSHNIPAEQKVTIKLEGLSINVALGELGEQTGYRFMADSPASDGKITRLIVQPKDRRQLDEEARKAPFSFTVDPRE